MPDSLGRTLCRTLKSESECFECFKKFKGWDGFYAKGLLFRDALTGSNTSTCEALTKLGYTFQVDFDEE